MFGAKVIAKGEQLEVLMATDLPCILSSMTTRIIDTRCN